MYNSLLLITRLALCDCPSTGIIAFAATISNDITNFGTNQTIVFDNVITNVGGTYDSRHGTFRAPVAGVYQFSFSILQGQSTMWLGVELVTDGRVIARVKTGDNGYWNMGSNVINTWLAANADVWVRHMSDSDTKHVVADTGYFTSFSGHIIHADSWMCWGWLKLDIILQEMDSVFHWYMNEIIFVIYLKYLESSCLRAKQSCNVRVLYCSRESVTWQHR